MLKNVQGETKEKILWWIRRTYFATQRTRKSECGRLFGNKSSLSYRNDTNLKSLSLCQGYQLTSNQVTQNRSELGIILQRMYRVSINIDLRLLKFSKHWCLIYKYSDRSMEVKLTADKPTNGMTWGVIWSFSSNNRYYLKISRIFSLSLSLSLSLWVFLVESLIYCR